MDEYFQRFSNEVIANELKNPSTIPALEYLINKYSKERAQIIAQGSLELGEVPKRRKLKHLLKEVKAEVDPFLGVTGIPKCKKCKIGYKGRFSKEVRGPIMAAVGIDALIASGFYYLAENPCDPAAMLFIGAGAGWLIAKIGSIAKDIYHRLRYESNEELGVGYYHHLSYISLIKSPRVRIITDIGHEYTHHVQMSRGITNKSNALLLEGMARSADRYVAQVYREREDNPSFKYITLNLDVAELKAAYTLICVENKRIPNPLLTHFNSTALDQVFIRQANQGHTSPHMLGNSFFLIKELEEGTDVSRRILNKEY